MKGKPRLAVVSPFLDKRHGTERRVVEWVSRLADAFEIHVYSQRVDDLNLSKITWHRIPKLRGSAPYQLLVVVFREPIRAYLAPPHSRATARHRFQSRCELP